MVILGAEDRDHADALGQGTGHRDVELVSCFQAFAVNVNALPEALIQTVLKRIDKLLDELDRLFLISWSTPTVAERRESARCTGPRRRVPDIPRRGLPDVRCR